MRTADKKAAWLRVLMAFVQYAGGHGRVPAFELVRVAGDKAGMCSVVQKINGDVSLFIKIYLYLCEDGHLKLCLSGDVVFASVGGRTVLSVATLRQEF